MPTQDPMRRRYPRLRSQHTVLFEPVERESKESLARTTAVGRGGLSFTTDEQLVIGDRLRVFVALRNEVVEAEADVVYVNATGGDEQEVGVRFIAVLEEHLERIEALFEPAEASTSPEEGDTAG